MFYLILLLLPLSLLAQQTPTIFHITQEQIKDIGGTIQLECSVQYAEEYTVVWIKTIKTVNERTGSIFLSTDGYLVIKDSRFTLRHVGGDDPPSSNYTLQITDIQETDAGSYQCQIVLSPANKISAEVLVSVRVPPMIADSSTQWLVVSEGKSTQMECYASGYPHPTITWRRRNSAILPTGMMQV